MPDAKVWERLTVLVQDQTFNQQAEILMRQRGFTALPPGYGSAAELALDYYARNDPAVVGRFLEEHERANGPLPERAAEPPAPQQPQRAPPPQPAAPKPQQPQSKIDPQTQERILKLIAPDKVAAQAKKMRGGSAFRQYLTPQLEQSAAAALKKYGAVIPKGFSAGETYLAGLALLPEADVPLFARETQGAFGDATELRQAQSKLTTHAYADRVAANVKKDEQHDPHRGVEPAGKAKEPTVRDAVAKAYYEQKTRAVRNGEPPKTPRRVYSKEDLETQKLKDKFFPDRARPIVLEPAVAHEIASEARDAAETEAFVNNDTGGEAAEGG